MGRTVADEVARGLVPLVVLQHLEFAKRFIEHAMDCARRGRAGQARYYVEHALYDLSRALEMLAALKEGEERG